MPESTGGYRQVRVLAYPGKESWSVAVVARSVSGRSSVDRIVWRGTVDGTPSAGTVTALLLALSDLLSDAAGRMG